MVLGKWVNRIQSPEVGEFCLTRRLLKGDPQGGGGTKCWTKKKLRPDSETASRIPEQWTPWCLSIQTKACPILLNLCDSIWPQEAKYFHHWRSPNGWEECIEGCSACKEAEHELAKKDMSWEVQTDSSIFEVLQARKNCLQYRTIPLT